MKILVSILLLVITLISPLLSLVVLINFHFIRALFEVNFFAPCYLTDCILQPSLFYGVVLPIIIIIIIIINILFFRAKNTKLSYKLNLIDFLIFYLILMTGFYVTLAPDLKASLTYFLQFLLLGLSYYFIAKFYFENTNNFQKDFFSLLFFFFFFELIISSIAVILVWINDIKIVRLTLPMVNPIPFALFIGLGTLISFIFFLYQKDFSKENVNTLAKSKIFRIFNIFILLYFFLILFYTNTRGPLVSLAFSLVFLLLYNYKKFVSPTGFFIFIFLILVLSYAVVTIGPDLLFERIINITSDPSILEREEAYIESIKIFSKSFWGVGTGAFSYYSFLDYPHNMFLENLANYGILGYIFNILVIYMLVYYVIKFSFSKNKLGLIIMSLVIYFFVETMFSFTLWMHKGLYLFWGILSAFVSKTYNKN